MSDRDPIPPPLVPIAWTRARNPTPPRTRASDDDAALNARTLCHLHRHQNEQTGASDAAMAIGWATLPDPHRRATFLRWLGYWGLRGDRIGSAADEDVANPFGDVLFALIQPLVLLAVRPCVSAASIDCSGPPASAAQRLLGWADPQIDCLSHHKNWAVVTACLAAGIDPEAAARAVVALAEGLAAAAPFWAPPEEPLPHRKNFNMFGALLALAWGITIRPDLLGRMPPPVAAQLRGVVHACLATMPILRDYGATDAADVLTAAAQVCDRICDRHALVAAAPVAEHPHPSARRSRVM